jgi:hypothetical protein
MKPGQCHATASAERHAPGCHPARPLCRYMRKRTAKRAVCRCDAYHFPHRSGSGACAIGIPAAILASASWRFYA